MRFCLRLMMPVIALMAVPVAAQPTDLLAPAPGAAAPPPAPLAELAHDDPWSARFHDAGEQIFSALESRDPARWVPLMGGIWLAPAERDRIAAWLADASGPFQASARENQAVAVFGWKPANPLSAEEKAAWDQRQQAEAIICRAPGYKFRFAWPKTAEAAMRGSTDHWREFACVRIVYSLADGSPRWRGFLD